MLIMLGDFTGNCKKQPENFSKYTKNYTFPTIINIH